MALLPISTGPHHRLARFDESAFNNKHEGFADRETTRGQGGIALLPEEEGKGLPVLPFQSYYGLLS